MTKDGEPVTTLQPYLGAFGHLVALRDGDLAYLHVHPEGDEPTAGQTAGPDVAFVAEVPTPGRYLLTWTSRSTGRSTAPPFVVDADRSRQPATPTPPTRTTTHPPTPSPTRMPTRAPSPATATATDPHHTPKEEPMTASPAPAPGHSIELEIGGMTCASCAMRIEKKLNKLDGVTATVNYATEKAQVRAPDGVDTEILIAEVAKAGYTASLPRNTDDTATGDASEEDAARHRVDRLATAPRRFSRSRRAGHCLVDDPGVPVRLLAVGVPDPGSTRGAVGCLALPPGRVDQPAARRRDHGHPGLPRHPVGARCGRCTHCSSAPPARPG